MRSVIATGAATAALIAATWWLPLLGIVLNGTSSLLHATVPELAPRGDAGRAFAVFCAAVIGSGAVAPIAYGAPGDHLGQAFGILAAALTALATVPPILGLRGRV